MAWVAMASLATLCVVLLAQGFARRGRLYGFPFFAAVMFLTFVLPQVPGLINDYFVPEDGLTRTLFFSAACLAACYAGWAIGLRGRGGWNIVFDEGRLLHAAAALSLIGAYFFYKFGQLPDEDRLRGMLTGASVAYLFFAKLLTYGLAIAVLCYARRPSGLALVIIAFDCLFYFERIVIAGRRAELAEICLIFALALWFQRRWAVPRSFAAAGIVMAVVGLLGAGEYRQATFYEGEPDWSRVTEIDLAKNWNRLLEEGGQEVQNLVYIMELKSESQQFNYGLSHWNDLVFTFVPAQLFGSDFKRSLALDLPPLLPRGYVATTGSTYTGMADAFASFWYFGFVKFLLVGMSLGWMYAAAMRGNTAMQVLYILSAVPSMLVVTHFTNEIVIAWIHTICFLVPVAIYASRGTSAERTAFTEARAVGV